ncbi:MAG: LPS export ABC transporter permease LptG, partial [Xanthomonas perforans]|nr:LPS export ABC transporter permease LptG [Xanthomonas perforans]
MRLTPRVHDWYVGRVVLFTVLLTWAVLLGLDLVNAFAGEAKNIGQGSYSFGHAVAF